MNLGSLLPNVIEQNLGVLDDRNLDLLDKHIKTVVVFLFSITFSPKDSGDCYSCFYLIMSWFL